MSKLFAKETELVGAFVEALALPRWSIGPAIGEGWTQYHETAGWDILLVHAETGMQIGVEAKLSLNAKVLEQALTGLRFADAAGPDYRAVLVPADACQNHMRTIASHCGIAVLTIGHESYGWPERKRWSLSPSELPEEAGYQYAQWHSWLPERRCALPDYVPDVRGGDSSPVALTPWKIKAIKLMILLERNGSVHRSDMKALGISPSRWTDCYHGFLAPTPNGYVACSRTPDLKAQHPVNWTQIEADFDTWNPYSTMRGAA